MPYSYGIFFPNGNPKSLNECFWAKDYEESNSSRHEVWWIAFYSGPESNGNPRITFIHKLDRWQTKHPRDIDFVFHVRFVTIGSGSSKRIVLDGRSLPDKNDHYHRNIEELAQMSFRKKVKQQKHVRFDETIKEIFLDAGVQNCDHYYRESIAEMTENQEISLDGFIADILVSLDAKYKELFCAETEIEKKGAETPNIKGAETPKIQGAGTPNIQDAGTPYIEGAGSPYIEGAVSPYIQGAVSLNIVGAVSPYILGGPSPENLNIIEAPNPSSPFGGTSSHIVPMSELHEGYEVGGTSVSSPTPPDVVLILAIPRVPQVGGPLFRTPTIAALPKSKKANAYCNADQPCTSRIDVSETPSPRVGIGVISLSSTDGPNVGIGEALSPRAGIGVTSPTTLHKRIGTAATTSALAYHRRRRA